MKISKRKSKLKIQSLTVNSFVTVSDTQLNAIRGGDTIDPDKTQSYCSGTNTHVNCREEL